MVKRSGNVGLLQTIPNLLISLASSKALAATDFLRYLTVFNDFPQKSLTRFGIARCGDDRSIKDAVAVSPDRSTENDLDQCHLAEKTDRGGKFAEGVCQPRQSL